MRKIKLVLLVFFAILLAGCKPNVACSKEAKICPDGTAIGRVPPDCEFEECPKADDKVTSGCDYEKDANKKYIGKTKDVCSRIRFQCEPERNPFFDDCGCGCELAGKNETGGKLKATDCTPEQKKAQVCIQIYKPVCGWFDPAKIQCIKYPCAQTFSNSCFACADEKVISWTGGECPE